MVVKQDKGFKFFFSLGFGKGICVEGSQELVKKAGSGEEMAGVCPPVLMTPRKEGEKQGGEN